MSAHWKMLAVLVIAGPAAAAESPPTFAADIAPIFRQHCVNCHQPGTAAPMSLLTYAEVRPWARSIAKKVAAREMPPWFAAPGSLKFRNENRLTDDEIARITQWADRGAPAGNLATLPDYAADNHDGWRLGTPDLVVTMNEPFHLADNDGDLLTRIVMNTGLTEDHWIRAVEVRPGNPRVVHHVVVIGGVADFSQGGRNATGMLSVYAVGSPPAQYPEGLGKRIAAGSAITLSMHYHKEAGPGTATSDQTSVGLYFTDDPEIEPITTAWVIERNLDIPPGEDRYETRASMTFLDDGHLYAFLPHMHYRGSDFQFRATYPDGTEELLLDVPNYDFNWQLWYYLEQPRPIPKGTTIEVLAHHDNSADNPRNPDPTRRVRWGGASTDEMMIGYFDYTYDTKKNLQGQFKR